MNRQGGQDPKERKSKTRIKIEKRIPLSIVPTRGAWEREPPLVFEEFLSLLH
jgi:hypothetical protein